MRTPRRIRWAFGLLLTLVTASIQGATEANFDDGQFPGEAGGGWVGPWQHPGGAVPQIVSINPLDAATPYLTYDLTAVVGRNVARQYQSSPEVDVTLPHVIRWKFRVQDVDFDSTFTTFNDRVHFFARNALRLTAGTDAATTWSISATGAAHTSGASSGKTFYIYDNVAGDSAFSPQNLVDTAIPIVPGHVYSFAVTVDPATVSYSAAIVDETSGAAFTSSAPHKFRALGATATSHNLLHFGVQVNASAQRRPFDLDSVSVSPANLGEVPPIISNVQPVDGAQHRAEEGIRFEVLSGTALEPGSIRLIVNSENVSGSLLLSGEPTHRLVKFENLLPNRIYQVEITATNAAGATTVAFSFNTNEGDTIIYDSAGFLDDVLYPVGSLTAVTHGGGTWIPAAAPAEIVSGTGDEHGKVLRRAQTGGSNTDFLAFTSTTAGKLTVQFDARVSITNDRTLDMMLQPSAGANMSSMLGWGINAGKVSYYDGVAWVPAADLDLAWHSYEMINYLSGPLARTWDLKMDGVVILRGLPWRHAIAPGTSFGRVRVGAIRGASDQLGFADIDNLVVLAGPEALPPPAISNIAPAHRAHFHPAEHGFRFEVSSPDAIPEEGIRLTLNGTDVSEDLAVAGEPTHRFVTYDRLLPDVIYTAAIHVANALGQNSAAVQFNTVTRTTAIVDVDGFTNETRYPVGILGAVNEDEGIWTPGRTGSPAEIVDLADGARGKVLRRSQVDLQNIDILDFTPFNAGALTIEFDARVSTTAGATLDVALKRTGQNMRAGWVAWGRVPGRISYHQSGAWTDFSDLDAEWHHYQIVNHLSGARAHTFDFLVDGIVIAENLGWSQGFAPGEFFGRVRIGAVDGLAGDYADIDNFKITLAPPPPAITGVVPGALALFHSASSGFQFQVTGGSELPSSAIQVTLNGTNITSALEITGSSGNWTVRYPGLVPNTFYAAVIDVTGPVGSAQLRHQFGTFAAQTIVEVEAEDYNFAGGQFIDNPPPSGYRANGDQVNGNGAGYVDADGLLDVDYFITVAPAGNPLEIYRFTDVSGTRYTSDQLRPKYVAENVPDYEIFGFQTGDWLNYTRTFPADEYQVFLRASSSHEQTIRLDQVLSDATQPGQSTAPVGVFIVPNTGDAHAYVPLTGAQGLPQTIALDGIDTVRLHAADATGVQVNFLLFLAVPALPEEIQILDSALSAGSFTFSFGTVSGRGYVVEFKNSLNDSQWTRLRDVSGTGSVVAVADAGPLGTQRFYRVRTQ